MPKKNKSLTDAILKTLRVNSIPVKNIKLQKNKQFLNLESKIMKGIKKFFETPF